MKKQAILIFLLCLALSFCSCSARPNGGSSNDLQSTEPGAVSGDPSDAADTEPAAVPDQTAEDTAAPVNAGAKDFTATVSLESERVAFCLPEDHDGLTFSDMGVNCVLNLDTYGNDVAAYHEFDNEGEITQKTAGGHTFDYQKFNHFGIENWRMYVIRIVHNGEYYRFVYNVYATEYDDAQVDKFMNTIRFSDET